MKVIIMSGIPGSGKSTIAEKLVEQHSGQSAIHTTDSYFIENGEYQFDKTKLHINHKKNQHAFEQSLKRKTPLVICDNTNLQQKHIGEYEALAFKYGYQVEVIKVGLFRDNAFIQMCAERNSHQVDLDTIKSMVGNKTQ